MAHLKTNPQIKLPKPSKEELEKSIKEIGYRNTDRKYGVCDNTARRWAMSYGIELVVKCVLKTRVRQETVLVAGKLVYEKDLTGKSERRVKEKSQLGQSDNKEVKKHSRNKNSSKKSMADSELDIEEKKIPAGTKPKEVVPAFVKQPVREHPVVDLNKIKNRYAKIELDKFRVMVEGKIREGFEAIIALKESLSRVGENGTDDTAASGNLFEEGTASMERENMTELVAKKQKHLNALNAALIRIGNGTYGICMVTGQLIPKERLFAVPHATKCVEAKADQDNGKVVTPVEATEDVEEDK